MAESESTCRECDSSGTCRRSKQDWHFVAGWLAFFRVGDRAHSMFGSGLEGLFHAEIGTFPRSETSESVRVWAILADGLDSDFRDTSLSVAILLWAGVDWRGSSRSARPSRSRLLQPAHTRADARWSMFAIVIRVTSGEQTLVPHGWSVPTRPVHEQ